MTTASNSATRLLSILAVDDDPLIRDLIDMVVEIYMPESSVKLAPDGKHALELLRNYDFDVLLTDIELPGMSGIDLISYVRKTIPGFPIVVHSGSRRESIENLPANIEVIVKGSADAKALTDAVQRVVNDRD